MSLPRRYRIPAACLLAAIALTGVASAAGAGASPNDTEREALAHFKGTLSGSIVWESNRSGAWELYLMNADGADAHQLTHLAKPGDQRTYTSYLRPRFSPDGKTIVFAYGKHHAPAEVWLVSPAGGDARKLTVGNPLSWANDGKSILLLRDSKIWRHVLATGEESLLHDAKMPIDGGSGSTVGAVHPDLKSVVLRSARKNEFVIFDQGKTVKTMGGCEPGFSADGRYLYWVQGPKDFRVWDMQTDEEHQILGTPPVEPFNYTYCPTMSLDSRWLLYGASPGDHSHDTSDYEVYIQEMKDWKPTGDPIRLTFNKRTDRWPCLFIAPPGHRAQNPDGPYDIAANPQTNPPPPPLSILTFAKEDADPDVGGEWGLWPQLDGCRATATFLPDADAEGGAGGAMDLDYTIAQAPRSFSLWIAADNHLDMSGYDHFVIFARGSAPSLTLVVKDKNAADPDAPDGIAEFALTGITADWQRFELPFAEFVPRKPGAQMDWRSIDHLGIAMIAPRDAPAASLQIDNLRAVFLGARAQTPPEQRPDRITSDLAALYTFQESEGAHADDYSGSRAPLPLTVDPAGAASWPKSGIAFESPTLMASAAPAANLINACRATNEITIEAWVRPANSRQEGPARIVTLSADHVVRNFTLGQSKGRYVVRLRTTKTSLNGTPSLQTPAGALTTSLAHVTYTRDRAGVARIAVDGRIVTTGKVPGDLSSWSPDFRLALANELTRDRTWLGRLRLVAIYSRALTPAEIMQNFQAGPDLRVDPSQLQQAKRDAAGPVGQVVWESNRNGAWQLYTVNMDGTGLRQLTSGPAEHTQASFSTDGKRLIFTRAQPGKPKAVWIMSNDGTDATQLIENAGGGEWRKGGDAIQFSRQPNPQKKHWQTWEYDCATGEERLLFPTPGVEFKLDIRCATGNDEGTRFVAWSPRPRGTWVLSPDGKLQKLVHAGCEGQVAADQRYAYGVHNTGRFVRFNLSDGGNMVTFKERTGAWSHTYFPCVSRSTDWLAYGACPPDQHDHNTSDYEIFIIRLRDWNESGEPIRLTFDKRTDRWPTIFVSPPASSPTIASHR